MGAHLDLLLEDLVVLLLLVQHVLLLGLLQGSFIDLPPVHLLQLLTLLKGKAVQRDRVQPARPTPCSDVSRRTSAPEVSCTGRTPGEERCP